MCDLGRFYQSLLNKRSEKSLKDLVVWKVMSIFVAEIPIIKNLNGMMEDKKRFNDGRRAFLKRLGLGVGTAVTMTMMEPLQMSATDKDS